jgi:c-di-GMP-binding flagellar brake protein YcgR
MKDVTHRGVERLYRPSSARLTIDGRTFTVHNLSEGGVGFMSDGPLPFKIKERLSMIMELEGRVVEMAGHVMHLSPMSELRSNLLPEKECYLCGISFETWEKGSREAIARYVDSRLSEATSCRKAAAR